MYTRTRQRKAAHRRRKALSRALHQVRTAKYFGQRSRSVWFPIPRKSGLRPHRKRLYVLFHYGIE